MLDFDAPYSLTIGGRASPGAGTLDVINPATGAAFASAPAAGAAQLDAAVAAARAAFPGWRDAGFDTRKAAIARLAAALKENVEGLARLLTQEQGKPLSQA